jgi:DNA-binding MarR family transcriptional regulator
MRNTSRGGKSTAAAIDAEARRFRELVLAFSRRRSLRDPVAGMCEEAQLTAPQIHALLWLGHDGPLTMGEIAQRVGVTEKTVTGLVDRLEDEAYLERVRDARDRRLVRAQLTPKGAGVYRDLDRHVHAKLAGMLAHLDAGDRKALYRILEKLFARLEAAAGEEAR